MLNERKISVIKSAHDRDAEDFKHKRRHKRRVGTGCLATINLEVFQVRDISSGGVAILSDIPLPRRCVIEVYEPDRPRRRCAAELVRRQGRVSAYVFRQVMIVNEN